MGAAVRDNDRVSSQTSSCTTVSHGVRRHKYMYMYVKGKTHAMFHMMSDDVSM